MSAPVQPAPNDQSTLRTQPVIGNTINTLSDSVYQQRMSTIQSMIDNGEIPAWAGQNAIAGITSARESALTKAVELQKKLSDIESSDATAAEKRSVAAKAVLQSRNNSWNEVNQLFKSGDIAGATQHAKEMGLAFDPSSPKDVMLMQQRAAGSEDAKAAREEARKDVDTDLKSAQAKKALKEAGMTKIDTAGLPDGFFRTEGNPEIFKMVKQKDGTIVPVQSSTDEVEAASTRSKRAGATTVSVNTSQVDNQPIPKGAVRLLGIKADDQIKATDALESARVVAENAAKLKALYPDVVKASGIDPSDSKFGAKFKSWMAVNIDNNSAAREYASRRQQLINANLRLNKGAQTDGDAVREGQALMNSDMPESAHTSTIDGIIARAQRQRNTAQGIQRGYVIPGEDADVTSDKANSAPPKKTTGPQQPVDLLKKYNF